MENCIFCKIVAGEIPAHKVYEDEDFLAFLDNKPNNLGHTLLIPKEHHKNIFDLPEELVIKIGKQIQTVAKGVLKGTGALGININMNNGETAGQLVWHSHIHIVPRFSNDGLHLWQRKEKENFTTDDFAKIAKKIGENI